MTVPFSMAYCRMPFAQQLCLLLPPPPHLHRHEEEDLVAVVQARVLAVVGTSMSAAWREEGQSGQRNDVSAWVCLLLRMNTAVVLGAAAAVVAAQGQSHRRRQQRR